MSKNSIAPLAVLVFLACTIGAAVVLMAQAHNCAIAAIWGTAMFVTLAVVWVLATIP